MKNQHRIAWANTFALFRGSATALADRMGISRVGLHNFKQLAHTNPPHDLLRSLAAVLARTGTADGSEPPSKEQLFIRWVAAKHGRVLTPKDAAVDALERGGRP